MAKFELNIYDMKTEKVTKTLKRNIMPTTLYCKYQDVNEKLNSKKIKNDTELFLNELKDLCLETFTDLTESEYVNNTSPAEVLQLYRKVLNKSLIIGDIDSKN